jgi:hypothetical protein
MRDLGLATAAMAKQLKIDRAIYLVDDRRRTYCFLRRNPAWESSIPVKTNAIRLASPAINGFSGTGKPKCTGVQDTGEAPDVTAGTHRQFACL